MSAITRRRFAAGALAASAAPVLGRAARAETAVKIGTAVLGDYSMAGPGIVAPQRGLFAADGGAVTELQGKSKVLLRLDAVTPKWISQIQYASEDAIRRLADPIRKSQRALFRAIKLMRETPKEAAELLAKKLGWPPEAVLAA